MPRLVVNVCSIIIFVIAFAFGQETDLCSSVYAHCKLQQQGNKVDQVQSSHAGPPGQIGKAGPRGFPGRKGEAGAVDYEVIDVKIAERIKDRVYYPTNCRHVHKFNSHLWSETGGLFNIYPSPTSDAMEVYCDLVTDSGGWIVFQRRMDGSEDFFRGWNDYVNGFGDKDKEFWLGLEKIHQLTKSGNYELRIDMKDWEGNSRYAKYGTFIVRDSTTNYQMTTENYSGDAGDALGDSQHKDRQFTTKDADHDTWGKNCAVEFHGAFWYGGCHVTNLNGRYVKGGNTDQFATSVVWRHWKGHNYSLKFVEMKMRPK